MTTVVSRGAEIVRIQKKKGYKPPTGRGGIRLPDGRRFIVTSWGTSSQEPGIIRAKGYIAAEVEIEVLP